MPKFPNSLGKSNSILKYVSLGSELLILMGLGVYGGFKLDEKWNTLPLFTILFPMIAIIFSFWKLLKNLNSDKKKEN